MANAEMLEDGAIDIDEYLAAANRFRECYLVAGVDIGEPIISPVDNVTLEWDFSGAHADLADDTRSAMTVCDRQWKPVVVAFTASAVSHMDPLLVAAVRECMNKAGYEIPASATKVADFVGDPDNEGASQRTTAVQCIFTESRGLYPDIPSVTVQY